MVANNATLDVNVVVTGKLLTLNGTGFGTLPAGGVGGTVGLLLPRGALNFTGAGTWSGNIILNTSNVVIGTGGGNGIVNGVISGSGVTLSKVNVNTLTLNGANTFTGNLTVSSGTVVLANANTYSGATTVGTTASLTVNNYGTILNTSSPITVGVGATLLIDNSGVLLTNRIAATTGITLNGATLQFNANNNLNITTTQTVGTITLASGQSTINAGYAATAVSGATSVLTSAGLSRSSGATVNFVGGTGNATPLGTSSNQLIFNSGLTTTGTAGNSTSMQFFGNQGNILPYAEVNGGVGSGDFATYLGTGIAAFNNYLTESFSGNSTLAVNANDIVKVLAFGSAAYTITATNQTVGALLFSNSSTPGVVVNLAVAGASGGAGTLTVTSGQIMTLSTLVAGATNIVGGTVNLGSEGIIFANNIGTGTTALNTILANNMSGNGLTLAGAAAAVLSLPNPNTYTGTTNVNQGTVNLGSASAFGPSTNPIVLTGVGAAASTVLQGSAGLTFGNSVSLNSSDITFAGAVPITFSGTTTLTGTSTLTVSDTAGVYFNGQLTGNGGLALSGAQTVFLTNQNSGLFPNSYAGGTLINGPTVVLGDNRALGSNSSSNLLGITAGTVVASTTALTLNQTLVLNGAVTFTGNQNITFTSPVTLTAANTLTVNNPLTTFSASIGEAAGARALTVNGLGTLALNSANTYSGGTTINMYTANAGAGVVNINTGSTLSSATPTNPLFSSSLGSGVVTFTSGVLNNTSAGTLTLNNVVVFSTTTDAIFNGNNLILSGNVSVTTSAVVLLGNTTTLTGTVSGAGTLTLSSTPVIAGSGTSSSIVAATGTLNLQGGSGVFTGNTFSGAVTINGGTLILSGQGTIASVAVTVATSGTFELDNSSNYLLTANPTSLTTRLTGASPALTLNGGTLFFNGSNTSGAVVLQTFTTVSLAVGNSTISLTKNTGVNALTIGTLTRTAGATVNFVGTDVALTTGGVGTAGNQVFVGALGTGAAGTTVNGGLATLAVTVSGYTSAPTSITFPAPTETGGVTATGYAIFNSATSLTIVITNPGSGYTSPPTTGFTFTGGGGSVSVFTAFLNTILPYASVSGPSSAFDFAGYFGAGAFGAASAISAFTGYLPATNTNINSVASNGKDVFKAVTGDTLSLTAATTVAGLLFANNSLSVTTGITGATAFPLIIASGGAVLANATAATISTNLLFTTGSEGIVNTNTGTLTVNGAITGNTGLTISGGGTLSLPNANTAGAVTSVTITAGGSGYTAGTVSATGGGGTGFAGTYTVTSGAVVSITITNAGVGYTSVPTIVFSNPGSSATVTAVVSTGGANFTGYTGATTFNGGTSTIVSGTSVTSTGTLSLGTNNAISSGSTSLVLNNGNITASAPITLTQATVTLNNSSITFSGSNAIILTGTVALGSSPVNDNLAIGNTGGVTLFGNITGSGNLTKIGSNTLFLTDANGTASASTGLVNIFQGTVNDQSATGLGAAAALAIVANGEKPCKRKAPLRLPLPSTLPSTAPRCKT